MTHLLTCFHTLADPDVLSEKEWKEGCESGRIDFSYIHKTINSFDESALELACRFRAAGDEDMTALTAVTIVDKTNETALRTLAALGFRRVARIDTGMDSAAEDLTSEMTADILASWITSQTEQDQTPPFDLIVTGQSSGDWNQGKVPMLIADKMGIKCISNVTGFMPSDDNGAIVTWLMDDISCSAYIEYPAVLSVGDVSGAFLRVPTLRQRMNTRQQPVEVSSISADSDHKNEGNEDAGRIPVVMTRMEPVIERRDAAVVDGSDPDAAADMMLRYFREWIEE